MHLIDYGHMRDGVLYHGTISDLDGLPKATWSYERGGKKVTHDQPIDCVAFLTLWNAIGREKVFRRNRVTDPNREVDPVGYHVISVISGDQKQPNRYYFAVPAGEADADFRQWLKALNIPKGSLAPEPPRGAGKPASKLAAAREKAYKSLFAKQFTVDRDEDPEGPPIDVYVFGPWEEGEVYDREFYTLVTSGLSDAPMSVPEDADFPRAELILYVEEVRDEHIEVLRFLARLPLVQDGTWYNPGTTMTNGQPPQPIFDGSALDCYLFLSSLVGEHREFHEKMTLAGDPLGLLWVVPITNAECQYIIDNDVNDFLEILDKKDHPFLLDEGRRSYIRKK